MSRLIECGAEVADATLVAIMIHGRGRDADEMAALAETLAVHGIRYYCPEAPERSWYPARFIDPVEANQPALGQSLAAIEAELSALHAAGFANERIVLCGFSQGGCLAAQTLLRRPASYAAVLLFTSGLIGPPGTIWRSPGRLSDVPVLLTGSETDEWVPAWRTRETHAVLTGLGARLETVIYESREHVVSDDEIVRARSLLERAAAARAPHLPDP